MFDRAVRPRNWVFALLLSATACAEGALNPDEPTGLPDLLEQMPDRAELQSVPNPVSMGEVLTPAPTVIEAGELTGYAEAARILGLTRARLTQVMNLLLLLSPAIQEQIVAGQVSATEFGREGSVS